MPVLFSPFLALTGTWQRVWKAPKFKLRRTLANILNNYTLFLKPSKIRWLIQLEQFTTGVQFKVQLNIQNKEIFIYIISIITFKGTLHSRILSLFTHNAHYNPNQFIKMSDSWTNHSFELDLFSESIWVTKPVWMIHSWIRRYRRFFRRLGI